MRRLLATFAAELRGHGQEAGNRAADLLDALPVIDPVGGGLSTLAHLDACLAAADRHPLTDAFAPYVPSAPWTYGTGKEMPACFVGRYGYCEIVGPGCPVPSDLIAFGAYLQFPDTWYPRHSHAAEELYFILSGTALWTRDEVDGVPAPPGTLIRHASFERHATRTGPEPLLAFWIWMGDLDFASYEIDPE